MPFSQVDDDGSLDCGSSLFTQLFFTSSLIFSLGAVPFPLFRFDRMIVSIRRSATLFSLPLHLSTYRRFISFKLLVLLAASTSFQSRTSATLSILY